MITKKSTVMCKYFRFTAPNTAYTLRAYLALQDIASFGCNVAYAQNVRQKTIRNYWEEHKSCPR
jgi:hypothetical protein